jgi:hypothetical protein
VASSSLRSRNTAESCPVRFDMICEAIDIEHRLAKPNYPWIDGQVDRMNRTIKEATVKRFRYGNHDQFWTHLAGFVAAYNVARRLKALSGLAPCKHLAEIRISEPGHFIVDPIYQTLGLSS